MTDPSDSDADKGPTSGATGVWRAAKSYEGQGPYVIWQVSAGKAGKRILVADATQRSFGVRFADARPEDLKTDGAVVAILRKHAKTSGLGPIVRHVPTGDIWIPLWTSRSETPDFWLQLAWVTPPELRFIARDGTVLVRKSSQGTYTKRRAFEGALPPALDPADLEDLATALTTQARTQAASSSSPAGDGASALPDFQREARDRLARRAKTVRKSLAKRNAEKSDAREQARFARDAELLRDHLHEVQDGVSELRVETDSEAVILELDPDLSPGQNLQEFYKRAKRAQRSGIKQGEQSQEAAAHLAQLEADLARLRSAPLSKGEVDAVLVRHRLPLERAVSSQGEPQSLPYKVYVFADGDHARPVELWVGRSAEGSDTMMRHAKANDHWLHVVGTTGSHVLIPAKGVRGELSDKILRMAAILALHHSKIRADQKGEVYVARRQNIRKRKGMPPGLWQVDKAETAYFKYDSLELDQVLARLKP